MTRKATRETSQAVGADCRLQRRPVQIMERHDMTEDSTTCTIGISANLKATCRGIRPTNGKMMTVWHRLLPNVASEQ